MTEFNIDYLLERMELFAKLACVEDVPNGSCLWLHGAIKDVLSEYRSHEISKEVLIQRFNFLADLAYRDSDSSWIGKEMVRVLKSYKEPK